MRGSLKQRYKGTWSLILDLGREIDPATGTAKRKQKWITFRGTKKEAETKLTELLRAEDTGMFVEPSKVTVIDYVQNTWLAAVKPMLRPETERVYRSIVTNHIAKSSMALMPLQKVRTSHLEQYYASRTTAAASSLGVHHAILQSAFKMAVRDHLLIVNPATAVENRRRPAKNDAAMNAEKHCWTADEAQRFLVTAKTSSPQLAAFFLLALDTGARKSELHGVQWSDIDFDKGCLTIARQLNRPGTAPTFGPTKTGHSRKIDLGAQTIEALRNHKRAQSELRMRNRTSYNDFGLVFAKEACDLQTADAALGQPTKTLSEAAFRRVVKTSGVRLIKFHGLRHTCATLLLQAGVPVHVVAQRLGHADVSMTLRVYAHVLPSMQQDAAERLARLLHR